jgi:hypothetical protein
MPPPFVPSLPPFMPFMPPPFMPPPFMPPLFPACRRRVASCS